MPPKVKKVPKKKNDKIITSRGSIPKFSKKHRFVRSLKHLIQKKMKKGLVLKPKKIEKPTKTVTLRKKPIKGKKAKEVVIQQKFARYSSTEPKKSKIVATKSRSRPNKLKKNITPGTVLILLSGVFAGKRVVFLKQLPSGLLLVTGPFKLNGVPLRRVNQRYVISTSTKLDISAVKIPEEINDTLFKKKKETKKSGAGVKEPKEQTLLAKKPEEKSGEKSEEVKKELEKRKQLQKQVDEPIIAAALKIKYYTEYLTKSFSLQKGQYPHELIF